MIVACSPHEAIVAAESPQHVSAAGPGENVRTACSEDPLSGASVLLAVLPKYRSGNGNRSDEQHGQSDEECVTTEQWRPR
jgi:hypothetical protein